VSDARLAGMECHCPHCDRMVEAVPPLPRWRFLLIAYWVALLALVPLFGGIVGLSLVLAPAMLAMGLAIGTLSRMSTTYRCPVCKAEVHTPDHIKHTYHWHAPHLREHAW
jgi:hypothetical protein